MKKASERKWINCKVCGKNPIETDAVAYTCWRCFMQQPERTVAEIDAIDRAIEKKSKIAVAETAIEETDKAETKAKTDKASNCVECGGPMKGRGYSHSETCSLNTKIKPQKVTQEKAEKCPVCGGPPYKRGYKHADGCSNSAIAKLKAKKVNNG